MILFYKKRRKGILSSFLDLLNVKYTEDYAEKLFHEHPYKYSLYGLSEMLSSYSVKNVALRLQNKEDELFKIEVPFIACIKSDFVIVYKITNEKVFYIWHDKEIETDVDMFLKIWTGIILIGEVDESSIEPDYRENRKLVFMKYIQKYILVFAVLLILLQTYIYKGGYLSLGLSLALIVSLFGIYISYLLTLKQIHIYSKQADKICSLFKQKDCNDILESDAAKLWGIGWSEIGLGYFTSNMIILLFVPQFISYLALINVFSLPYSFWSVWYQKFKIKQWCVLCLIAQILLWTTFLINISFGFIRILSFSIYDILCVGAIYIIPILVINLLVPILGEGKKVKQLMQDLNSIKMDESVFYSLLVKQPHYKVDKTTSQILWGNSNADILITVLTNPHCMPCARMHERIDKLIEDTDNLCFQYVFSSFNESLYSTNKYLTAVYINNSSETAKKIFNEWFNEGKFNEEGFINKYPQNVDSYQVIQEFEKHNTWKENTKITATPTILINGYKLPDNYKIEDLKHFTSWEVTV